MKGRSALDPRLNLGTAWAKNLPLALLIPAAIWALMIIGAMLIDRSELGAPSRSYLSAFSTQSRSILSCKPWWDCWSLSAEERKRDDGSGGGRLLWPSIRWPELSLR